MASIWLLRRWMRLGSLAGVLTEDGRGEQSAGGEEVRVDGDGAPAREGHDGLVPGTLFRKPWVDVGELILRLGG